MNSSDASSPAIADNASQRERLTLRGHSTPLDASIYAVRPDLADVELADRVFAPHYARAVSYKVLADAPLLAEPREGAEGRAQLAARSVFGVLDISGGYAWGKSADGTPGYLPMQILAR